MKSFFLILVSLIFFIGCSEKNAFSKFSMDKAQELGASSLQTSKIIEKQGEVAGTISTIYLNEVYPMEFNKLDSFFVYMYLKDSKNKSLSEPQFNLKMNSKSPIKVTKLSNKSEFTHLIDTQNSWTSYYLVEFEKDGDTLKLVFDNGLLVSESVLKYKKDE